MAESTAPAAPVPAPTAPSAFPLLTALFALLAAHRSAFRQERPHQWVTRLVVGWLLVFERHTVTRVLAALGVVGTDWSGFSRLLACPRVAYDRPTRCLLRQTLVLAVASSPSLVAMDGVVILRHSTTMLVTGWVLASQTAPFRRGTRGRCRCAGTRPSHPRRSRPRE